MSNFALNVYALGILSNIHAQNNAMEFPPLFSSWFFMCISFIISDLVFIHFAGVFCVCVWYIIKLWFHASSYGHLNSCFLSVLLLFVNLTIFYLWVGVCFCKSVTNLCGVQRGQKRVWDLLEMELQVVLACFTWVLELSSRTLEEQLHLQQTILSQ